ncbi:MAG: twin-arginine translocase subunit TatC [Gammaproteobacteria bacterium]|nr:twin-arginine translocase subunit TatC [Gammaproteobacteria bacterium]
MPDTKPGEDREQPLLAHLVELRARLLRAAIGFLLVLLPLALLARQLYQFLAEPLLRLLPKGGTMIATQVASPFFTPLKLAAVLSLFVALPWVLYQIWAFVAPGLYRHERKLVAPLLFTSTLLFYLGVAFAYLLVLPRMFEFFLAVTPSGVSMMTDINAYLDFVLKLFVAFGFAFETPVAIVLLCWMGFVTPAQLAKRRDYVIVGCFALAAVITPPDVLSQVILALATYALFELGIVWARWSLRFKSQTPPPEPR